MLHILVTTRKLFYQRERERDIISYIISTKILFCLCTQESEAPQGLSGAMISAVKRGCVEAVSQLLLQGAPLNVKDSVRHSFIIPSTLHAGKYFRVE